MSRSLIVSAVASVLSFVVGGCGGDTPGSAANTPTAICAPGATQACLCTAGNLGVQACSADGMVWEGCVCGDTPDTTSVYPNSCDGTRLMPGIAGQPCNDCGVWTCITSDILRCVGDPELLLCTHPSLEDAGVYACLKDGTAKLRWACPEGCADGACLHPSWSVAWEGDDGDTLLDIFGADDDDIYAVGDRGLVLHWDGAAWTRLEQELTTGGLNAVWSGAGETWVTTTGAVLRLAAGEWRAMLEDSYDWYRSVWGTTDGSVFIGTSNGEILEYHRAWDVAGPLPPGDTCATATPITVSGAYVGSTAGLTNDYSPFTACGGTAYGPDQVWKVDLGAGESVTVDYASNGYYSSNGLVYLVTDCAAIQDSCQGAASLYSSPVTYTAMAATTVYLIADGDGLDTTDNYTLGVTLSTSAPATGGDTFAAAMPITASGTYDGTTVPVASNYATATCVGGYATSGRDQVWKVDLGAGDTVSARLQADFYGAVVYFIEDPLDVAGSCVAGTSMGSGSWSPSISYAACAPTTLYIVVDSTYTYDYGVYRLDVTLGSMTHSGDTCAAANDITGPGVYVGTTGCAAADYAPTTRECAGIDFAPGADQAWRVSLTAGQALTVNVQTSTFDPVLYLVRDCAAVDDTCLAGAWGASASDRTLTYTACTDQTLFLIVDSTTPDNAGAYTLTVDIEGQVWSRVSVGVYDDIVAFWGPSRAYLRALGSQGTVYRFDGDLCRWTPEYTPVPYSLWSTDLWGTSPTDIYATAHGGLLHFDGAAWTLDPALADETLLGVWGRSPTDVFVMTADAFWHFDGDAWTAQDPGFSSASGVGTYGDLRALWGTAGPGVWAVGRELDPDVGYTRGVIVHAPDL